MAAGSVCFPEVDSGHEWTVHVIRAKSGNEYLDPKIRYTFGYLIIKIGKTSHRHFLKQILELNLYHVYCGQARHGTAYIPS